MAPILKNGLYEIRFVPRFIHPPIHGGSYATAEGVNDPVRAEALNPKVEGNQKWEVESVAGKDNIFTITRPKFIPPGGGHGPALPGFGLSEIANKETVVLSIGIQEFHIQVAADATAKYLITNITVPGLHVDTIQAVTEENQVLYVQTFVIGSHVPLPRWEFIPVKH